MINILVYGPYWTSEFDHRHINVNSCLRSESKFRFLLFRLHFALSSASLVMRPLAVRQFSLRQISIFGVFTFDPSSVGGLRRL